MIFVMIFDINDICNDILFLYFDVYFCVLPSILL